MNELAAIYKWFNMKYHSYDKLEDDVSIYLYYKGEYYADMVIVYHYSWLLYKIEFWEEFCTVFPMEQKKFETIISKWVEDTFNLKGVTAHSCLEENLGALSVPS